MVLRAIRRALGGAAHGEHVTAAHPRHQLQLAVAVLLHEARRADYNEGGEESAAAGRALRELFGLGHEECVELLRQGRERAQELASLFAPLTVIKRELSMAERIRLLEHLWRVSFADGQLNLYEDHYVRKVAHLLYIPNTQSMLARNRARAQG
ncbi:MAG: TerB family tellurite resistance protein [Betaproteobacteria bacterium]